MEEAQRQLESSLNEFFAPSTSNERKRQIEVMLENFSKSPGSWKQALYFISHPQSSQYVIMYCLSVIESSIKIRWFTMNTGEQNELKSTIYYFLGSEHSKRQPPYVRNKIIKLLTDIGKFSWPHSYPDFFTNIYEIASNDDSIIPGLIFLKTIAEEWPNAKDEISSDRKTELKSLLIAELPKIYQFFLKTLEASFNERRDLPPIPPSPTSSSEDSNSNNGYAKSSRLNESITLCLEGISTWTPIYCSSLSNQPSVAPYPIELVQLLCKLVLTDLFSPNTEQNHAILALGAINELLYRKYFPKEFDDQMNFIAKFAIELLNKILGFFGSVNLSHSNAKVIEFLSLITSHFYRYDESTAKAFMSLLLPFTFKQSDPRFYYQSLDVWARLLSYLTAQSAIQAPNYEELLESFKSPILGLANGIIQSNIKFQAGVADESFDIEDDEDGEAPTLLRNADLLVKIGDLLPTETLQIVSNTWEESCRFYADLFIHLDHTKTVLNYENTIEIEHFSFIVQFAGRVASIFYDGAVFKQELELGKSLFQQLVQVALFSKHFYFVKSPEIIIKANCEIIYSLKSWTYWLSRYHSEIILGDSTLSDQQTFFETLGLLAELVFFSMENRNSIHPSIVLAHAHFFSTLINSIRTQYLFQVASVKSLVQKIHPLRNSMDPETFRTLNKSIGGLLFLPWQNVSLQEWEHRTELYSIYMRPILGELANSSSNPDLIIYHIHILMDQLELLKSEGGVSKKICWEILKEIVPFLHTLLSTYLRRPGVGEEILNLFLKIMEVLGQQAGPAYFEDSIRRFIETFSSENIINDLLRETESSCIVIEKFLNMLQFMLKDPSSSFKKFLPESLAFAYDQLYPILAQRSTPDLKIPFFHLVRDCLLFRWTYFFPGLSSQQKLSNLQSTMMTSPDPSNPLFTQMIEDPLIAKRFEQILESLGHSFLQPELSIFRFNLSTLSIVNEKHKLFNRLTPQILSQFLTVLLQVLVQKSHDLLLEEVSSIIWEMSTSPRVQIFEEFLPNFLTVHFPHLSIEQRGKLLSKFDFGGGGKNYSFETRSIGSQIVDQPSFIQALNKFIDDLRYFHFLSECQRSSATSTNDQS